MELIAIREPFHERVNLDGSKYKELLADYDKRILEAVIRQEGSIPKAAKCLGVDATTIRRKLERYKRER